MDRSQALQKLKDVADVVPSEDVLRFFSSVMELHKENLATKREIARIEATRDVALEQIRSKHDLYRKAMTLIFNERSGAIAKHFELIDRGIERSDRELMLRGLEGVARIVSNSPFADLKALAQALEGDKPIEI